MRSARALPQNHPRLRPVSERRLISGGGNLEIIQPRQCASQCFRRRVPQIEAELEVSFGFHEMQPNRARYSPRCSKVRRRTDSLRVVRQSSSRSGKGTVGEYPFASTKPRLGLRPIRPAGFFAFPKRRPLLPKSSSASRLRAGAYSEQFWRQDHATRVKPGRMKDCWMIRL